MKQHIKLKLKQAISAVRFPHWQDILQKKGIAKTNLHPEIDLVFDKYQLPIWVTQEYRPSGQNWDVTELAAGLDRIYRIILQRDREIPPELIRELSDVPIVEEAQVGAIGRVDLPKLMPTQMSVVSD